MQLLLATTNQGKVKEFGVLMKNLSLEIICLSDLPSYQEVVEDGDTFQANAIKKAREYGIQAQLLTLADDSGLMVDALQGQPGVFSKRYGATDQDRNHKLLQELASTPFPHRTAQFTAVIALYDPADDRVYTSVGHSSGFILNEPEGTHGFGYDPIFFSTELNKAFGQATLAEKNTVSHRNRAFREILPILHNLTQTTPTI